jgi:restriction system protein
VYLYGLSRLGRGCGGFGLHAALYDLPQRFRATYDFEKKTAELFGKLGFESIVTKQSGDGGIDVVAVNNGVIFRDKYLIQCKRYNPRNKVSRPEVTGFYARIASEPGAKGIFVTTSAFTRGAREFVQSTGINPIDGEELERLFLRHHLL